MAQAQVDFLKKKFYRDASTDTNDKKSISITLSHSKSV